jgi:hypothetical protein
MQDDDLEEINELYQQLSAEVCEMEAAAVQIEDDQFQPDEASLTEAGKSLRKLAKRKQEFWHNWCAIGFQGLDRSYKWTQDQRDSQEKGRVLLRDGAAASSTCKLARRVRGFSDEKSGRVRRVFVANKSFTEDVFRTPTKPIYEIVLVVPAEDANLPTLPAYAGPQWICRPLLALMWTCQHLLTLLQIQPCRPRLALMWACQLLLTHQGTW